MKGYITLDRTLCATRTWKEPPLLKAYLQLMMAANIEEEAVPHHSMQLVVHRGELLTTHDELQRRWQGAMPYTTRTVLKIWKQDGLIRTRRAGKTGMVVTLLHYEKPAPRAANATRNGATKLPPTYYNRKEEKKNYIILNDGPADIDYNEHF